jgi:hypothetical protein
MRHSLSRILAIRQGENWNFPCQSHYWIKHNRVRWAGRWSREEIEAGRAADAVAKARYFGGEAAEPEPPTPAPKVGAQPVAGVTVRSPEGTRQKVRGWRKLFRWLFGR